MKTTNEILKSFCGNDERRNWINYPFRVDNIAYATDATILVSVNSEHIEEFELLNTLDEVKIQNVLITERRLKDPILVSELQKLIKEAPQQDCFDVSGSEIDCNECDGYGEVTWEYGSHEMEHDCPVCHGVGTTGRIKRTPNGKTEISDNAHIEIGEARFKASMINRVLEVAKEVDCKEIEILFHGNANKPCLFKVGKFEILCMTVIKDRDQKVIAKY